MSALQEEGILLEFNKTAVQPSCSEQERTVSMSLKIPIETSARHIHVSSEDFETLFGPGAKPTFAKELSQPGQYACKERLTVIGIRDNAINKF